MKMHINVKNQNFHFSTFSMEGLSSVFLKNIYVHQGTLLIFYFFIKFNYLNQIKHYFFQIVDFTTFSIVFILLFLKNC